MPDGTRTNYADASTNLPWNDPANNDGFAGPAPVGSFPQGATPEGLLDMAGNASEWSSTPRLGVIDPRDQRILPWEQRRSVPFELLLAPQLMYVVTDGSFDSAADDLRAADIRMLPPKTAHRAGRSLPKTAARSVSAPYQVATAITAAGRAESPSRTFHSQTAARTAIRQCQ